MFLVPSALFSIAFAASCIPLFPPYAVLLIPTFSRLFLFDNVRYAGVPQGGRPALLYTFLSYTT
jgi:hypothetical protein